VRGELLNLKETLNTMVEQLRSFAAEVTRVAREVGTDGKLGGQANVTGVAGTWKDLTDNVNLLAANLTTQVRNIAKSPTAVARGDLSRKITVDVKGEILELKVTINTMVDQLNAFAAEVTRVAREVGTDGKLGGQAQVPGVAGTWKDLTDNVNVMAANLTEQVRGIVKVVTAVANGDLKPKLVVNAKGEVAALAETINAMTGTLATFADQVTTVAREVGVEGRLGGQANVPGAAGTWKDLTGNVNLLAANLTTQVPRHRRGRDRGDAGRPDALDPGRCARRGGRAQGQHQHDDRQPAADHRPQHRAGLAQDQPAPLHRHAAGPARPRDGGPRAAVRADDAGQRPAGRDLPGRGPRAQADRVVRRRRQERPLADPELGEGLVGQCATRSACS
jgi:HAMP domain-containing protein